MPRMPELQRKAMAGVRREDGGVPTATGPVANLL